MPANGHVPVMLERVVALVAPALEHPGAVLVDATLGLAGHATAILSHCPQSRLVGIDRDAEALEKARARLAPHDHRTTLVHAVYDQLGAVLGDLGLDHVDGVLFDLGVSSMQVDRPDRGFAYSQDTLLDMRMDQRGGGTTAADVLNTYSAEDLARILRSYGDERFARRIAAAIVRERAVEPFSTSGRLVEVLRKAIPPAARRTGGNPANRTFQALRIEVNDELATLRRALPAAIDALAVGGRIVVLSYQSLEDRLVKRALSARARPGVPEDLPVVPTRHLPELRLLTRGAEQASRSEVLANPRAASVRLRAAERVREAA